MIVVTVVTKKVAYIHLVLRANSLVTIIVAFHNLKFAMELMIARTT